MTAKNKKQKEGKRKQEMMNNDSTIISLMSTVPADIKDNLGKCQNPPRAPLPSQATYLMSGILNLKPFSCQYEFLYYHEQMSVFALI